MWFRKGECVIALGEMWCDIVKGVVLKKDERVVMVNRWEEEGFGMIR